MATKTKKIELGNEEQFNKLVESMKFTNDYLKHIATLDTGLLVILAAFSQNFSVLSKGVELYSSIVSACALLISLLCVLLTQSTLVDIVSWSADEINLSRIKTYKSIYRITMNIAYTTFMVGVTYFGVIILNKVLSY